MKKLLLLLICLCGLFMYSQERKSYHGLGISYGMGDDYTGKKYEHDNHYFRVNYLYTPKQTKHFFLYQVLIAPEINFAKHGRDIYSEFNYKEYSLNVGGIARREINKHVSVLILASSGPAYLTSATERQSLGFAMVENVAGGFSYKIDDVTFTASAGIRHISNANTRPVNHGIDTTTMELGVSLPLK
jgi:hypothetical protein